MTVIETRQKGDLSGWWCNGTINGYDVSFEATTMSAAQEMMAQYLSKNAIKGVRWAPVAYAKNKRR